MVELKSGREIRIIGESGKILQKVFRALRPMMKQGVSGLDLDQAAEKVIRENGAQASFRGYRGYPATICLSLNEEVVHGIPDRRKLMNGDVVSVDVGAKWKGFHSDAARTWTVGGVDDHRQKLIAVTKDSFDAALAAYKPGWRIGDISEAVQKYVESHGFQVVREYAGHGIGRELHEDPQVPNYGKAGRGTKIEPGLVLAIEPMVTAGHYAVETLANGWTVVTKDRKCASHYEDTVAFTEDGFINLTRDEATE
ncbi:MAG TPA: type I methionyl aminopeptidase [Candidatus Omnitrophota bacterium]|jgi:methionyl aminopeptidase|nr:type I methionyl aminopeptidase [Candidatus Omnitrophota bacterium]HPW65199.1 type I methionyl aminopeptidase [Candidatus Omnitrophota bacterium]